MSLSRVTANVAKTQHSEHGQRSDREASRTALATAYLRAAHQLLDAHALDPVLSDLMEKV